MAAIAKGASPFRARRLRARALRASPVAKARATGHQRLLAPFRRAPVAQWIEQRFPKPRALVRFRAGASPLAETKEAGLQAFQHVRSCLRVSAGACGRSAG